MPHHLKMPPLVCIFLPLSRKAVRDKLHGILRYERIHGPWRVYLQDLSPSEEFFCRGYEHFDGIIADVSGRTKIDEQILDANVPTVLVDHPELERPRERIALVNSDGEAIGRMGAEHLLECGLTQFAFVDSDDSWNVDVPFYSEKRRLGFVQRINEAGYSCSVYTLSEKRKEKNGKILSLQDWLKGLPKPVGVMSAWDTRGHQVISACQFCDILVPEEVAVVAVDNDEAICQASKPTLSSVVTDFENGGFLAAQTLDKILKGEIVSSEPTQFYQPLYVYRRRSTDVKPNLEPFVRDTLDYIEAYAGVGINVSDIIRHFKISRRFLEMRFREVMGHSILEEIHRARFQRARYLLLETDLSSAEIAKLCGYENVQYFYKSFKKLTGKTTSLFRRDRG